MQRYVARNTKVSRATDHRAKMEMGCNFKTFCPCMCLGKFAFKKLIRYCIIVSFP